MRFPDEEPETWEQDWIDWSEHEDRHAPRTCKRCGHDDHRAKDCHIVTPDLLKGDR